MASGLFCCQALRCRFLRSSGFISKVTPDFVDIHVPARPTPWILINPWVYVRLSQSHWIGKNVPRSDARWVGQLLGRLSKTQILDAFRAAGYSSPEVDGFAAVVENRIEQLKRL